MHYTQQAKNNVYRHWWPIQSMRYTQQAKNYAYRDYAIQSMCYTHQAKNNVYRQWLGNTKYALHSTG